MKKFFGLVLAMMLLGVAPFSYAIEAVAGTAGLPQQQDSLAYKQYQKRPKTELSKLIYLMDRYKGTEYKVLFDGAEYDSLTALKYAKKYIAKHYKKEDAKSWLEANAYRSPSGKVIYLKDTAGKTLVLKDTLIAELKRLK